MNPIKTSSPLRILLVEDDEHDRLAFHRAFEKSPIACEITECIWAEDALLQLLADASLFDVVVIDYKLPGMSGLDLCNELLRTKTPLPLVILTGHGSEQLAVEALTDGVDNYIIKDPGHGYLGLLPVVLPEAVRRHEDRLARRRAEEALEKAHDELEQRVEERTAELARTTEKLRLELTERKRAEKALRESEERYRTLFDSDPNSIFVLKLETSKILDVNARALEVYGYEKEELIGKSFMDLGPDKYPDGVLSATGPRLPTQCSVYPRVQHRRKDGTSFYVNVYACKSKGGRKHGAIATTVDITESLAKDAQLIQASKMSTLGEMATGVAHELNQPLSTIQIGADFFKNMVRRGRQIPHEELALVSEQMADQVARAVRIINHMREFGRKTEDQLEKVDINQPLGEVFALLSQQLRVQGIKIVLDLKDGLPPIIGDSNRLEQVFIDLVVNARDAMGKKKERLEGEASENTLTVKSFLENSQVAVTIADTGNGIPEDIREKIFEPFFTTKEVGKGTGLGLSISYGIVKDHNGTIELESEVDKGTTFKITFPAYEEI
ncbi:MAG: PAS domain S-box protein [Desulfobacterales bacterium]|nr:PAS domain S-box protein [Desulfobacterales bacterium]